MLLTSNCSKDPIRQITIEDLGKIQLTTNWQQFPNACRDHFRDSDKYWLNSPWGKIINEKRVFVVLSFESKAHSTWKLFVDGIFISDMANIAVHMGSARNAMLEAEKKVS